MTAASQPRLLVLTASPFQIPILQRARALGIWTVAADRDPNAPAFLAADERVCADVTDCDGIVAVARRHGVTGVIAEQSDVAVRTAAFVAAELGLPGIGIEAARRATDKQAMRDACVAAGIPMPTYRAVATAAEATAVARAIGFPAIVKPSDGQASRGVTKVYEEPDVAAAFERAHAASSSGVVLVEELLFGTEGSIESFVTHDAVTVLAYCDKVKSPPPFSYDLRLVYPGDYPAAVIDEIVALNESVIRAVGITMGLAHLEFIVTSRGVRLIEVAARGCGARVATDLLPALTGVDVIGLRVRQALGEAVPAPVPERKRFGVLRFIELPPGRVEHMADPAAALAIRNTLLVHVARRVGDTIERAQNADGRPGFVTVTGSDRQSALAMAENAIRALDIRVVPIVPAAIA